MARTGHGEPRYPRRKPDRLSTTTLDGVRLGPTLAPQETFIWVRRILRADDRELKEAFGLVAGMTDEEIAAAWPEITPGERREMRTASAEVGAGRLQAWRTRNRQMTWLELRALLLGLTEADRL